jgi:hypothetical protein
MERYGIALDDFAKIGKGAARPNPHFPLRRDAARLGFERSGDPEADLGRSRC